MTSSNLIQVLLVDDHEVVREGCRRSLMVDSDIEVVAEANSCYVPSYSNHFVPPYLWWDKRSCLTEFQRKRCPSLAWDIFVQSKFFLYVPSDSCGYKYKGSGAGFRVDSLWTSLRDHGQKLCTARGQQAAHRLHTASTH